MEVVFTFAPRPAAGTGVAPSAAKLLILAKNVLLFICRSSRFVLMNSLMALWGRIAKKIKSRKKVGLAIRPVRHKQDRGEFSDRLQVHLVLCPPTPWPSAYRAGLALAGRPKRLGRVNEFLMKTRRVMTRATESG